MGVIVTPREVGGSLVVSIPKKEVKKRNIQAGVPLEADFKPIQKSMFGALKGKIGPLTKEDRWHDHE